MSLKEFADRTNDIELLTATLKQQLGLLKRAFGDPLKGALGQSSASNDSSSNTAVSQAPPGTYVVFISTHAEQVPYDVIAAYLMVSRLLRKSPIKLTLVDKQMHKIPSLFTPSKQAIHGNYNITRLLYRLAGKEPSSIVDTTSLDEWTQHCTNGLNFHKKENFHHFIDKLNNHLQYRSYLVGYYPTSVDISLYHSLFYCLDWHKMKETIQINHGAFHLLRYYNTLAKSSLLENATGYANDAMDRAKKQQEASKKWKEKGGKGGKNKKSSNNKPDLASKDGASWDIGISDEWMGRIVTRFPPEPSGYLHIGHAKAAFMNREIANRFKGKMLIRMDDTNPSKEKGEYVENIKRDLESLQIVPDNAISHTSDYFALYMKYCEQAIKDGHAYADLTNDKEMQTERKAKIASKYRDEDVDSNLRLWKEMQIASDEGLKCCIRIKLDMQSNNGTLRDPVIYRCNVTDPHPMTGFKYKVYPTYDFACPIVDSIEGVTHALRSKEYNERDEQYSMIWDLVCKGKQYKGTELVKPNIYQFSRLEFVRTELSKRKLQLMIDSGKADGWDDPRLPTVQGILRRGLQVDALKQFVYESATSKRNNLQEWDKLWTFNKKMLDPVVSRYFAVECGEDVSNTTKIVLENVDDNSCYMRPLLPKKPDGAQKALHVSKSVLLEQFDIDLIFSQKPSKIGLMNLGIIDISEINESTNVIKATLNLKDKNFRKKQICTWVTGNVKDCVPLKLVELDYLFTSDGEPNEEATWFESFAYGEPAMRMVKKGEVIQLLKRGFYICDKPYLGRVNEPAVYIFVPDGKSSAMSKLAGATNKVKIATR